MKRGVLASVLFALAAVTALAGCGGGDSTSDGTAQAGTLTKAEFIKQGDAICKAAEKRKTAAIEAAFNAQKKTGKNFTQAQQEELVTDVALPPIQQMVDELGELPLPEGQENQAEAVIDGLQEGIEKAEADPKSVFSGPEPFEAPKAKAGKFGFKSCNGF